MRRTFLLFLPYFLHRESRYYFLAAIIIMGVDISATTYLPFCFKNIVEVLGTATTTDALLALVGIFLGATFIVKTASFLQDLLFYPVINLSIREFHFRTAAHIHTLSLKDYHSLSIPEVISFQKRIGLSARFFLRSLLVSVTPTLLKFIFAFSVIWSLNVFRVGLLCGILILFVMFCFAMRWYISMRLRAWKATDKATMIIGDSILNTKLVRFYKTFEMNRLRTAVREEATTWFHMTMRMDMLQVFMGAVIALIVGGIIGFGAYQVHHGTMTIGQFILLNGQLTALFIPIKQTLTDMRLIVESSVDFDKIAEVLMLPEEKKETIPAHFDMSAPCISFDHVVFAYTPNKPVFNDLSLTIQSRETVLFFGVSGVGKSTLLSLMTGLLTPTSGTVKLFGQDIASLSLEDVGRVIHFIPQDNQLFNGTFYENVTFGVDDVDAHALDEALDAAELTDLIKRLNDGIHTVIGEMGSKLSGGEKQRLALARALLLKPKVLIFDETTNAMDKETEKKVFDNIRDRINTLIFISHKPAVVHQIDRFLEVKKGSVREEMSDS
ncbi:MAG: ABC transporter ATP-binding protein/permease [Alphaproteobacteria bacterium]|nr:ABC transporter ATP-binding protein/permease [Alphaproteobacteria bacterium]